MILVEDAIKLREALAHRTDPITLDEVLEIVGGASRDDQIIATKLLASIGWHPRRVKSMPGFARVRTRPDYAKVNWRRRA